MAQVAKRDENPETAVPIAAPTRESGWSGEVHGPVAALHQAIEDRLLVGGQMAVAPFVERPVDRIVRHASRATGWLVLGGAFIATFNLIA